MSNFNPVDPSTFDPIGLNINYALNYVAPFGPKTIMTGPYSIDPVYYSGYNWETATVQFLTDYLIYDPRINGVADWQVDAGNEQVTEYSPNPPIYYHSATFGEIVGAHYLTYGGQIAAPDASWHLRGTGDLNGDGIPDMLWKNDNGTLVDWTLTTSANGAQIASVQQLTLNGSVIAPDASWQLQGEMNQDFNGDHKNDLLWRNDNGRLVEWNMNGAQIAGSQYVTLGGQLATPDANWQIAMVGDVTGDGKSDLLWRNSVTNQLIEWAMDGGQITSMQSITLGGVLAEPDSSWHVVDGGMQPGHITWANTAGTTVDWTMNGGQITKIS